MLDSRLPVSVNTDPLWIGQDLVFDASDTLQQLRVGLARRYQFHTVSDPIIGFDRLNVDNLGTGLVGFRECGPGLIDRDAVLPGLNSDTAGADPLEVDPHPDRIGCVATGQGTGIAGSNPTWQRHPGGLTISVDRPSQNLGSAIVGHSAAVNVAGTIFRSPWGPFHGPKGRFLLYATFRRPAWSGLVNGSWAAVLSLHTSHRDSPMGVTCQFRTDGGVRLNNPRTGFQANRPNPNLAEAVKTKIKDAVNPANFTLVLEYFRSRTPHDAFAALIVDHQIVDSFPFNFVNIAPAVNLQPVLKHFMVGVATAGGTGFTVKIDLIDFQIWTPLFPQ